MNWQSNITEYPYLENYSSFVSDKTHKWKVIKNNKLFLKQDGHIVNVCLVQCSECSLCAVSKLIDNYIPSIYKYYTDEKIINCNDRIIKKILS